MARTWALGSDCWRTRTPRNIIKRPLTEPDLLWQTQATSQHKPQDQASGAQTWPECQQQRMTSRPRCAQVTNFAAGTHGTWSCCTPASKALRNIALWREYAAKVQGGCPAPPNEPHYFEVIIHLRSPHRDGFQQACLTEPCAGCVTVAAVDRQQRPPPASGMPMEANCGTGAAEPLS